MWQRQHFNVSLWLLTFHHERALARTLARHGLRTKWPAVNLLRAIFLSPGALVLLTGLGVSVSGSGHLSIDGCSSARWGIARWQRRQLRRMAIVPLPCLTRHQL